MLVLDFFQSSGQDERFSNKTLTTTAAGESDNRVWVTVLYQFLILSWLQLVPSDERDGSLSYDVVYGEEIDCALWWGCCLRRVHVGFLVWNDNFAYCVLRIFRGFDNSGLPRFVPLQPLYMLGNEFLCSKGFSDRSWAPHKSLRYLYRCRYATSTKDLSTPGSVVWNGRSLTCNIPCCRTWTT